MKSIVDVDLYKHISLNVDGLKFCGIWFHIPHTVTSLKFWGFVFSRIIIGLLVFVIPTCSQLIYLVKLILYGNAEIQEVAGIINLILAELLTSVKLLDLRLRRDRLNKLIGQLGTLPSFSFTEVHKQILEKAVKQSRLTFKVSYFLTAFDICAHVLLVPAVDLFKTLPLKMDLLYIDVNEEPYFKYICAYQILYKPVMLTTFVILHTFPWSCMICAVSQLDVLIYNFENMKALVDNTKNEKKCNENEAFEEIFIRCVLHHRAIIRFVKTLEATFSGQLSATLLLCTLIVGTTGVQLLAIESPLQNIPTVIWVLAYIVFIILMLYVDCYFGNTITVKSMYLSTAAYASPWINLSPKMKKNLLIFMTNNQQPVTFMMGSLVPVSINTFTLVMNWTYKGFAILNQMKD